MSVLLVAGLWVLNLGISVFNAVSVGKSWVEAKHAGGLPRFMAWMGAIMAACGFTWCIAIVLAIIVGAAHVLTPAQVMLFLNSTYLVVVPFILFSGVAITLRSWARAYRGSLADKGVAAWNTFAQIHNTFEAINTLPDVFDKVLDGFGSLFDDSDDNPAAALALLVIGVLLAVSLGGGIGITYLIIHKYAGAEERMALKREAVT